MAGPNNVDDVFVHARVPLHLVQRTGTRLNQLISPFWADRPRSHRAVTMGLAGVDLAIAARLRRDRRLQLGWRLALDAAELALAYAMARRDDYEEASVPSIPGCPLAVEAGGRLGWRGLVVPAVNLAVGAKVRTARGHAARSGTMAWQVAAAVGGMGLAAYGRRRRAAELERHRRERAALLSQAELAGRHDVAMAEASLLDEIQRATALIDLGVGQPVSRNIAGAWKADLAAEGRREFSYLGDELARWQAEWNAAEPDLRRVARLRVPEAARTVILSDDQAAALHEALDGLALTGEHEVDVVEGRSEVRVRVAGSTIALRPQEPVPRLTFDPVPGAFCWSALWLAVAGARSREHVPRWASLGPAAVALAAAFQAHREGRRGDGRAPRDAVLARSAAITLASAALHTRTMRNTHGHGGISRYPFSLSLRGFLLVALLCWREVSGTAKAGIAATAAGTVAVGWALSPEPRSGRELVAELVWPFQSVTLGGSLVEGIDRDAERTAEEVRRGDAEDLAAARAAGRAAALRFAAACIADAERALADAADELAADVAAEAERRVERCRTAVDGAVATLT